ncbi:unnamed protein product [Linum trigynum]|uniref:Uncharacterized protein n=1 Tax=Linum trigynum TaxID=586398 RepID=A0AAV2EB16_9ROSI
MATVDEGVTVDDYWDWEQEDEGAGGDARQGDDDGWRRGAGEGKGLELGRESASGLFWGKPGMFVGRDEIVHGIDCELGMAEEELKLES